jgi:phenylpyruvate tautomerase PptA (4-oxalocrotonate tautomerase family)
VLDGHLDLTITRIILSLRALDYDDRHGGDQGADAMPMMDLTYPAGALTPEARAKLVDELTTVLLRAERAPDAQFFRDITWVYLHELPEGAVLAAGKPVAQPTFRLAVTVPDGALSERRKEELVREATARVMNAAGLEAADALRVWVLINEVPDGNWGAAGNVVRFEQLRQAAAHESESAGAAAAEFEPVGSGG